MNQIDIPHRPESSRLGGFTLVELLVVIGIIALLISALLPALNKARQAANFIDCQARLRTMGQSLYIYSTNNRGLLPWADFNRTPTPDNNSSTWWWYFTLSDLLNKGVLNQNGTIYKLSPIFRDKDTIDATEGQYICHYTANPRILYEPQDSDQLPDGTFIAAKDRRQRRLASVKPSNAFVLWDGPQCLHFGSDATANADQACSAYGIAIEMDSNKMTYGHCFCLGLAGENYSRPVMPGHQTSPGNPPSAAICKSAQIKFNVDLQQAFDSPDGWNSHLRFRHLKNSALAALCIDGHVETRRIGEFLLKDVCTNVPN